jgi:hypothetical protein
MLEVLALVQVLYITGRFITVPCVSVTHISTFDFLPALSLAQILHYLANHPTSGHSIGLFPLIFNYIF